MNYPAYWLSINDVPDTKFQVLAVNDKFRGLVVEYPKNTIVHNNPLLRTGFKPVPNQPHRYFWLGDFQKGWRQITYVFKDVEQVEFDSEQHILLADLLRPSNNVDYNAVEQKTSDEQETEAEQSQEPPAEEEPEPAPEQSAAQEPEPEQGSLVDSDLESESVESEPEEQQAAKTNQGDQGSSDPEDRPDVPSSEDNADDAGKSQSDDEEQRPEDVDVASLVQQHASGKKRKRRERKIVDVGVVKGFAIKDIRGKSADFVLSAINKMTVTQQDMLVTRDALWPPLEYTKMAEDGYSQEAVYIIKEVRDSIYKKPGLIKKGRGRRADLYHRNIPAYQVYADTILALRDAFDGAKTVDEALNALIDVMTGDLEMDQAKLTGFNSSSYNPISPVDKDSEGMEVDMDSRELRSVFDVSGVARRLLPVIIPDDTEKERDSIERTVSSISRRAKDWGFLKRNHPLRRAAKGLGPVEKKTGKGNTRPTRVERKPYSEVQRIGGKQWRKGDVTAEDLIEVFNLSGVEFGNWVTQEERQELMNHAFDSFCDQAQALNVPTSLMGLGGQLGLCFGSRGRGGRSPACAHFEPQNFAINITKKGGAGSLAHEWGHAFDAFLSSHTPDRVRKGLMLSDYTKPEDVRMDESVGQRGERVYNELLSELSASGITPLMTKEFYGHFEQLLSDLKFDDTSERRAQESLHKYLESEFSNALSRAVRWIDDDPESYDQAKSNPAAYALEHIDRLYDKFLSPHEIAVEVEKSWKYFKSENPEDLPDVPDDIYDQVVAGLKGHKSYTLKGIAEYHENKEDGTFASRLIQKDTVDALATFLEGKYKSQFSGEALTQVLSNIIRRATLGVGNGRENTFRSLRIVTLAMEQMGMKRPQCYSPDKPTKEDLHVADLLYNKKGEFQKNLRQSALRDSGIWIFRRSAQRFTMTALYDRCKELDKKRKKYFQTDVELFARAFETYIKYRLDTKGIQNDFLVAAAKANNPAEFDHQSYFPSGHLFHKTMSNFGAMFSCMNVRMEETKSQTRERRMGAVAYSLDGAGTVTNLPPKVTAELVFEEIRGLIGHAANIEVADTLGEYIGSPIAGYYDDAEQAIKISMSASNPLDAAHHEAFHFAQERLLSASDNKLIEREFKSGTASYNQLLKALVKDGRHEAAREAMSSNHEACAYGYEYWQAGKLELSKPSTGVFSRIKSFFNKVKGVMAQAGFESAEDVFQAFHDGYYGVQNHAYGMDEEDYMRGLDDADSKPMVSTMDLA